MSGFAAINGEPDGPPLLPPIALTDEVAALAGAFGIMVALRARDAMILRCIETFGTLPRAALEAYGIKILRDLTLGDRRAIYRALDGEAPGVDFRRPLRT